MSHSLTRHSGDKRSLGQFSKPVMALVDMIAEQDWERVISLTEEIAGEARFQIVQQEILKSETLKR